MIELEGHDQYRVAVVGATGAVGREMVSILEARRFPVESLHLFASSRSAGQDIPFRGESVRVEELTEEAFAACSPQLALFSAGAALSRSFAEVAVQKGAVVIDNSSAFRMEPDVPLVVPEVNPHALADYRLRGIIANPNCSTIQMVMVLHPIREAAGLRRVVVSTYQSVSGAGQGGIAELSSQCLALFNQKDLKVQKFPHQIAFNCIPHIGAFREDGYTDEEWKLVVETRKILELPDLSVSPTAVRVPVFACHGEALNVETVEPLSAGEVRVLLEEFPGVKVVDDPARALYPHNFKLAGTDAVYVGRIRNDLDNESAFNCFVVADNLRKGAALNAVQIAEVLVAEYA